MRPALAWVASACLGLFAAARFAIAAMPTTAASAPLVEGRWVRPATAATTAAAMTTTAAAGATQSAAEPTWGHAYGLRIGLAHADRGPRGLLRVYTPYLDQPAGRVINFIAVEPTPRGREQRGLSELERSTLDGVRGKRF